MKRQPDDHRLFKSRLGDIAVTDRHVERDKREAKEWEVLEKNFPEEVLVDKLHYSNIEEMTYEDSSPYPCIKFQTPRGEKKLFFSVTDNYKDCFTEIKERMAAYRQKH